VRVVAAAVIDQQYPHAIAAPGRSPA